MKNKKSEISANTIVGVIIILIGFAIALFVYFNIKNVDIIDQETCHDSIIFRATANLAIGSQTNLPLKCRTEKICITAGLIGGKCENDFGKSKGITKVKVKTIKQIEKVIADNIVDCWKITGEGKLSLFKQDSAVNYGVGSIYSSCIICSRIAFDMEGLKKVHITEKELSDMNVDEYMRNYPIPEQNLSYDDYLSGGLIKVKPELFEGIFPAQTLDAEKTIENQNQQDKYFEDDLIALKNKLNKDEIKVVDKQESSNLQSKEIAILFMQITAPNHGEAVVNVGKKALGVSAGAFMANQQMTISAFKILVNACKSNPYAAVACGAILVIAGIYQQANIAVQRTKSAGICQDVLIGGEERNGCSVVRTVGYDVNDFNTYCNKIESIS